MERQARHLLLFLSIARHFDIVLVDWIILCLYRIKTKVPKKGGSIALLGWLSKLSKMIININVNIGVSQGTTLKEQL